MNWAKNPFFRHQNQIPPFLPLQKGGIPPLWKRGVRGDFDNDMSFQSLAPQQANGGRPSWIIGQVMLLTLHSDSSPHVKVMIWPYRHYQAGRWLLPCNFPFPNFRKRCILQSKISKKGRKNERISKEELIGTDCKPCRIFVILSSINATLYPFASPIGYVLSVIQIPALIAGAMATGRDSINWVVYLIILFFTYIIIFSVLIFVFQIVLAKVINRPNH